MGSCRRKVEICKLLSRTLYFIDSVFFNSEAMPYFPSRIQPVNVKLGIERESKVEVPLFSFIKLGKRKADTKYKTTQFKY